MFKHRFCPGLILGSSEILVLFRPLARAFSNLHHLGVSCCSPIAARVRHVLTLKIRRGRGRVSGAGAGAVVVKT